MLGRIKKNTVLGDSISLIGACDNFFQSTVLPLSVRDQLIAIVNLSLMVKVMMKFQRFLTHSACG